MIIQDIEVIKPILDMPNLPVARLCGSPPRPAHRREVLDRGRRSPPHRLSSAVTAEMMKTGAR